MDHHRPDIISGFNDNQFDWMVILKRLHEHDLTDEFYKRLSMELYFAKNLAVHLPVMNKMYSFIRSDEIKIKGDEYMKYNRTMLRGCICVDTMCLMRKMHPDDDKYSLNHFLDKLGLPAKHDVGYAEMEQFRINSTKDPHNFVNMTMMRKVVDYCINDSTSCCLLLQSRW
jgi:DNA polymerase elongation subunit (family B)